MQENSNRLLTSWYHSALMELEFYKFLDEMRDPHILLQGGLCGFLV